MTLTQPCKLTILQYKLKIKKRQHCSKQNITYYSSFLSIAFYLQWHLKYSRTILEKIFYDILREACKFKYYFSLHSKELLDTQCQNFVWAVSFPLTVTWVLCINQLYFIFRKNNFAYLSEWHGRKPYQFFCTFPWFFLYQIQLIFLMNKI